MSGLENLILTVFVVMVIPILLLYWSYRQKKYYRDHPEEAAIYLQKYLQKYYQKKEKAQQRERELKEKQDQFIRKVLLALWPYIQILFFILLAYLAYSYLGRLPHWVVMGVGIIIVLAWGINSVEQKLYRVAHHVSQRHNELVETVNYLIGRLDKLDEKLDELSCRVDMLSDD